MERQQQVQRAIKRMVRLLEVKAPEELVKAEEAYIGRLYGVSAEEVQEAIKACLAA
jgi:1-aminocyclopropane-1-carboxylate deaminase/D-cysteine desulfhydrase-like pyridoxal-dependent ACC family enzyme